MKKKILNRKFIIKKKYFFSCNWLFVSSKKEKKGLIIWSNSFVRSWRDFFFEWLIRDWMSTLSTMFRKKLPYNLVICSLPNKTRIVYILITDFFSLLNEPRLNVWLLIMFKLHVVKRVTYFVRWLWLFLGKKN